MSDLISVAPGVLVATSRHDSANTVVLASISEALIIDPSWAPNELDDLAEQLTDRGLHVLAGISTHAHFDHMLWHPAFGPAPRYASRYTIALAKARRDELLRDWDESLDSGTTLAERDDLTQVFGQLTATPHAPADPDSIWLPRGSAPQGFNPQLIVHNAHVAGHTAVWLPDQRILISGDMLSDIEPPLPDQDADATAKLLNRRPHHGDRGRDDYLAGLDILEPYARDAQILIPGHGNVGTDALARLERERAALNATA